MPKMDKESSSGHLPTACRRFSHSWCHASSCVSIVLMTSKKSQSTWRPEELVVPE